jgi:hypothetical protein
MTVPAAPDATGEIATGEVATREVATDTDELPRLPSASGGETDGSAGAAPTPAAGPRWWLGHPASVLIAAVTGGLLAYAFHAGPRAALIGVASAQAVLILSWAARRGPAGRLSVLVLGAATAVAADSVVSHWRSDVGALAAVLGLAPVALFAYQLVRGRRREQVIASLSDSALLIVALAAFATLIELRHQVDGPSMTVAVLLGVSAALVAGHLIDWLWDPLRFDPAVSRGLPAVIGSVIAGAVVTMMRLHNSVEFNGQRALLLGAALAVVTALFAVGAAFLEPTDGSDGRDGWDGPGEPIRPGESIGPIDATAASEPAELDPSVPSARPRGRIEPTANLTSATLFVFALMSPLAYLLCLALRG